VSACESERPSGVAEARLESPAHAHAARDAIDLPLQLAVRRQAVVGKRQRIGETDTALVGSERCLEHVCVWQVPPRCGEGSVGLKREPAAALRVEDGREDGGRVEVRQWEPVDRTVAGDERDGAAVADCGVLAQ
jgi:hypothetical protein